MPAALKSQHTQSGNVVKAHLNTDKDIIVRQWGSVARDLV
jgi:hypothetical protein